MTQNPYALEHSLELYEKYPTVRCRPVCTGEKAASAMRVIRPKWAHIAPEKGVFHFDLVENPAGPEETVLLHVDLTPPAWAEGPEDAAAFVRLLGAALEGGASYAGALVELGGISEGAKKAMLRAWRVGFDRTALVARAEDTALLEALRREGITFGLLLNVTGGILPARETLARNHLQRVWETAPVFLRAMDCPEGLQELRRVAAGWHALAADVPGLVPGRLTLRRLTYPAAVEAGGALPMRFWWQVMGDSPIYGPTKVVARLVGENQIDLPLEDEKFIRLPGDATHNQIVTLPPLPMGEYTLLIGVEGADGKLLPLAMDAPLKDGLYEVGKVVLDETPRPELFAAWDDYYPEGYYPLEDPKLPY